MWDRIVRQIPSRHLTPALSRSLFGCRSALSEFAAVNAPIRYLEVGCRLGHSLAVVAMSAPLEYATTIDAWIDNYGDEPNPGPDAVLVNLNALGIDTSKITILTGDSHTILPTVTRTFNLVLVDGDHTWGGARSDLIDCANLLEVGGLLVFDDAVDHLLDVWRGTMRGSPNLDCFEVLDNHPWCGAVRLA